MRLFRRLSSWVRRRRTQPEGPSLQVGGWAPRDEAICTAAAEPVPEPDPSAVARADKLMSDLDTAMREENAPASFIGYDKPDDVTVADMRPGRRCSVDIEDELYELLTSRPEVFRGTRFEDLIPDGEDHPGPF